MDKHNYSFFGQRTGIIIQSSSKSTPEIFVRCTKKKEDESWEKPSQGEGKTVKFSLDELATMKLFFENKLETFSTYHSYQDQGTQIGLNWDDDRTKVWFKIGDYHKSLSLPQIEVLKALFQHLFKEKIAYATGGSDDRDNSESESSSAPRIVSRKNYDKENEIIEIDGKIKRRTDKALLIEFGDEKEIWIPKSTIRSPYDTTNQENQHLTIEEWVLRKNKIIA